MNKREEFVFKAISQIGFGEVNGDADNPEILKYFDELGFDGKKLKDETAWCSAFVNWCAKTCGLEYSGKLNARSWLTVGEPLEENCEPQIGDLVVFWRGSKDSWKGHVGIYMNKVDNWIFVLGGNQSNSVSVMPYSDSRLLEYRVIV